eukprot:gnl/TRDRNA2_/TRDRNA2_40614_c0_seq1.p1 gnl/TRDRNA2_/TRDRNA2_40614_c0~~gnl/TRDRNA2_/TRDRNA2_40614_c0_seq1.p1  ORF type:complete len:503 (-),score=89.82 gnl/TRDRNA2_/TRDRNA2_40614_c0_seq1:52-1560(-)
MHAPLCTDAEKTEDVHETQRSSRSAAIAVSIATGFLVSLLFFQCMPRFSSPPAGLEDHGDELIHHGDLENTTFAKIGHLSIPVQKAVRTVQSRPALASSALGSHTRGFLPGREVLAGPRCSPHIKYNADIPYFPDRRVVATNAEGLSTAPRSGRSTSDTAPGKRVVIFGATGYIGRFVVAESIGRGYETVAFTRERSGVGGKNTKADVEKDFAGAEVVYGNVLDDSVQRAFEGSKPVDTVVVCLASRTGGVQDSFDIDYAATKRVMDFARKNKVRHFVLLSAICVQKPTLAFQKAKLKFEAELQAAGDISYSIVRPTAFFKSLAAQIEPCKAGGPYVMFGDGTEASCKPISERDLAAYMINCVEDKSLENKILPIGGPGKELSAKEQGEILFKVLGREPNMLSVPVALFDVINGFLAGLANIFPALTDAAEFGQIGKYYAVESMLVYDAEKGEYLPGEFTPSYGDDTLEKFYEEAVRDGLKGQELGDQAPWEQWFKKKDENE